MKKLRIGIIGAGERGCYILGTRILEMARTLNMEITAVCDSNPARIRDAREHIGRYQSQPVSGYGDYKALIDDPQVDLVLITNHTDGHTLPAVYALHAHKHVYLDKPIAVRHEDSLPILEAEIASGNQLIMGFTRRYEQSWRTVAELAASGAIGSLQMIQIRSIIPYTRYLQMWHRHHDWSGGALNDKSSHHFDVFNWLAESRCLSVSASGGKSSFFAPRADAPERCSQCDDTACPYRRSANPNDDREGTHVLHLNSWVEAEDERSRADTCVYAPGADIIDHAVCTLQYENGIIASLFWAIYGPHADDQETLELVGSRGRILMERSSGIITLYTIGDGEGNEQMQRISAAGEHFDSSHYGADIQLIKDLRTFCDLREGGQSTEQMHIAHASDGHRSLLMIEAALASMHAGGTPVMPEQESI